MRLRPHLKEMPSSGCPDGEGTGPRPPEVLGRALLVGWALWASGVARWGVTPVHCLANEWGSASATAAILLSPAGHPPLPPPALDHSRQTHVFIFHSFAFLISLSVSPPPQPPKPALQCASLFGGSGPLSTMSELPAEAGEEAWASPLLPDAWYSGVSYSGQGHDPRRLLLNRERRKK